ncbi:MAG: hypothetical protein ABFE01_15035 [Phycisphaerales bacterium]
MMRLASPVLLVTTIIIPSVAWAMEQPSGKSDSPREVTLVVWPARIDAAGTSLTLLPKAADLSAGDGAAFYNKAVQALPPDLQRGQVTYWAREPIRNLPLDQAEAQAVLQQTQASLDLVERGARCKDCNWPAFVPGTMPANLSQYRQLQDLLCLKARIELLQSQFDKAARTIGTGLAMSKHVGEGPTVMQGMTGVAMATLLLRPVEDWTQIQGSPNLYPALHALPRPLVDVNVGIAAELKSLESNKQYNSLVKMMFRRQLESSFAAVRRLMERLDSAVAALECVEGLRHFAAGHDGRLPAQLSDIADIQLPNDPATGKPFAYRVEGTKAVLEAAAPKGGGPRDVLRYTITVAR